jgi:signal transduction histidine kinase
LDSLEIDVAGLWLPAEEKDTLMLSAMHTRDSSADMQAFVRASQQLRLAKAAVLPGRVWEEQRSIWVGQISTEPGFVRRAQAMAAGLHSGLAFPIQNEGRFFGVLEFFTRQPLGLDGDLLNMMTAIGSEIGQFNQRRIAEEELHRAHDELEIRVQRRTAELKAANAKLQTAIFERKRLENELLEITEKERRRIALDLHDDLGQKLSGIALMTKGLENKLTKLKADTAQEAARIHALVQETMSHASDLAHDLATLDLQKKTLPEALTQLTEHARELFGICCEFVHHGNVPSLDPSTVMQLYKIAQEALTNAIKHGKSTHVNIGLDTEPERLSISIENTGLPFPDLEHRSTGMGLRIMNYRASLIGGTLDIKAKGENGTRVTCVLPLDGKK